jgi:hypothetical protein
MAVIINELEVVVEPARPAGRGTAPLAVPAAPIINPLDVADILERQARYAARLSAE